MVFRIFCCVVSTLLMSLYAWSSTDVGHVLRVSSSHSKSIQQEIVPRFKKYHLKKFKKPIEVEWLYQGGASEALRYVMARYEKNKATSGIDIFFGGGEQPISELQKLGLLQQYNVSKDLLKEITPPKGASFISYNEKRTWYAVNYSSYGLFYNKRLFEKLKKMYPKLQEPRKWEDLADITYFDLLTSADPRRSSSHLAIYNVIIQVFGWKKGWELLTRMAANTRKFALSSSAPVKAVVSGDAFGGISVDFFALAKIGDLGEKNLGFCFPAHQTPVNADPVAILKGAPNTLAAQRFVDFLLDHETQKLFILPKGAKSGPTFSTLGRPAVNRKAYDDTKGVRLSGVTNPFDLQMSPFVLDKSHAAKMQFVLSDLMGAVLIDTHKDLREAVRYLRQKKRLDDIKDLVFPITEKEMLQLAEKWNDQKFRNVTIGQWLEQATTLYKEVRNSHSQKKSTDKTKNLKK